MGRVSAKGNYLIKEDENVKTTHLILTNIGGKHLVGTYPWSVYGRQGAYEAARSKFKQETEAVDVFSC
jgi:hypothetical protein